MSDLAIIQEAIEGSQKKVQALFDAQKKEIEATGVVSKQLQTEVRKIIKGKYIFAGGRFYARSGRY